MKNTSVNRNEKSEWKKPDVVGWGADLAVENRSGVPREGNSETVLTGKHDPVAFRQTPHLRLNKTVERSRLTPVFGTSGDPQIVSGRIRDFAFRYSENRLKHWMLLLLADRIHMVEGWVLDIAQGKMPMILPRMELRTTDHLREISAQGLKKKDKENLAKLGLAALGAGALIFLLSGRFGSKPRRSGAAA